MEQPQLLLLRLKASWGFAYDFMIVFILSFCYLKDLCHQRKWNLEEYLIVLCMSLNKISERWGPIVHPYRTPFRTLAISTQKHNLNEWRPALCICLLHYNTRSAIFICMICLCFTQHNSFYYTIMHWSL